MNGRERIGCNDLSLKSTFEFIFRHSAPFTKQELESFEGPLSLSGVKDFTLLRHCLKLKHLEIFASEFKDLSAFSNLNNLSTLKISCSNLERIQEISKYHKLENLELICTLVEDLSPIMSLPGLRQGVLIGNPFTPESYYQLRYKLLNTPTEKWKRPPAIEFSNERDWVLTREIFERGLKICFTHIDGDRPVLVRPGISLMQNSECDFISLPDWYIRNKLKEKSLTTESLFESLLTEDVRNADSRSFDFQTHRVIGNHTDAVNWVLDSSLIPSEKDFLSQFLHRFENRYFYKEDTTFLNRFEEREQVRLPVWLREVRKILAYVEPEFQNYEIQVKFDRIIVLLNGLENADELWWSLGLRGYSDHEEREILQSVKEMCLLPIGSVMYTEEATLAINLSDQADKSVYAYNANLLYEEAAIGNFPLSTLIYLAFDSYLEMFSHIVAIRLPSGEVIEAKG